MARPKKYRKVCHFPQTLAFAPVGGEDEAHAVVLTVDEYETIRLIDKEGLSQEQCGKQMGVARTTVQFIYTAARKKLADALVEGRTIQIGGGDYQLCGGDAQLHGCRGCFKQKFSQQYGKPKDENLLRVAVPFENGQVFPHFGRAEQLKVYDAKDGKVLASEVVDTRGGGHGGLAGILTALHVDALICGGIGGGAQAALAAAGISLYGGVSGDADEAVNALLDGTLVFLCREDPVPHGNEQDRRHGRSPDHGQRGCQK